MGCRTRFGRRAHAIGCRPCRADSRDASSSVGSSVRLKGTVHRHPCRLRLTVVCKRRIERALDGLFEGEEAVLHLIERIVGPLGLRVDESSPRADARLPDGSRVHTSDRHISIQRDDGVQLRRSPRTRPGEQRQTSPQGGVRFAGGVQANGSYRAWCLLGSQAERSTA
jgi:hypothetical protein